LSKVVLDTTYLLPYVGIRVEGIGDIERKLEKYEVCYPTLLILELEAVILKEARRKGLEEIPRDVRRRVDYLLYGGWIELIPPRGEDLQVIHFILRRGWRDIFDAILYATAVRINAGILTMDTTFRKFLRDRGFNYQILIGEEEL